MYSSKLIARVAIQGSSQIAVLQPNMFAAAAVERAGVVERVEFRLAAARMRLIEKKPSASNYGIIGNLFELVPAITQEIETGDVRV